MTQFSPKVLNFSHTVPFKQTKIWTLEIESVRQAMGNGITKRHKIDRKKSHDENEMLDVP